MGGKTASAQSTSKTTNAQSTRSALDNLAAGLSPNEIVCSYPSLQPDDIAAAIAYAAEIARERVVVTPLEAAA